MNAKTIEWWECNECGRPYATKDNADRCCGGVCDVCGKPNPNIFGQDFACDECREARETADWEAKIAKAVIVHVWQGPVWDPVADEYHQGVEEASYRVKSSRWMFVCNTEPAINVDVDRMIDDFREEVDFSKADVKGLDEFQDAAERFEEANKHIVTYAVNLDKVVMVHPDEANEHATQGE